MLLPLEAKSGTGRYSSYHITVSQTPVHLLSPAWQSPGVGGGSEGGGSCLGSWFQLPETWVRRRVGAAVVTLQGIND